MGAGRDNSDRVVHKAALIAAGNTKAAHRRGSGRVRAARDNRSAGGGTRLKKKGVRKGEKPRTRDRESGGRVKSASDTGN